MNPFITAALTEKYSDDTPLTTPSRIIPSLQSFNPLYPNCPYCGSPFAPTTKRQLFCRPACKVAYWRLWTPKRVRGTGRVPARTKKTSTQSMISALLSGDTSQLQNVICKTCHGPMNPYEKYLYCSPRCRDIMLRHLKSRVLAREAKRANTGFTDPNNPNKEAQLVFLRTLIQKEIDWIYQELAWTNETTS